MSETRRLRFLLSTFAILSSLLLFSLWQPFYPVPSSLSLHPPNPLHHLPPQTPSSPLSSPHHRTLVIARTSSEDVRWLYDELSGEQNLTLAVYTVDSDNGNGNPAAPPPGMYTVPANKGHEVMPYLTYIIDHYHNLSDVTLFMHAHRYSWHNNDLLDGDAAKMIRWLNTEKVVREGYMNLRCPLTPGCPRHIHPLTDLPTPSTPEATSFTSIFPVLFPNTSIPATLSGPCCGQFAVSRGRIRSIPRERYGRWRDWLVGTEVEDRISGRVWEYLWQWVWRDLEGDEGEGVGEGGVEGGDKGEGEKGEGGVNCPDEERCYCEGFGVCFERAGAGAEVGGKGEGGGEGGAGGAGGGGYERWVSMQARKKELEKVRGEIRREKEKEGKERDGGGDDVALPEMEREIGRLEERMRRLRDEAVERGRGWGRGKVG